MSNKEELMTFGGHLNVLRKMLIRISIVVIIIACAIFYFKEQTFSFLLSPSDSNFCTYRWLERFIGTLNPNFHFDNFHVDLITTDLSSQFITHITTALYLGFLCGSPFILYELFKFTSPALLESERKSSVRIICIVYLFFIAGIFMSYFVLFPISFRFLGTYTVAERVQSTITLDSYISTFITLTLMMGLVFQLPVIAYILARTGVVQSSYLIQYRSYAFIIICLLAAIITPPDVMTLILVAVPLYLLYEISIKVIKRIERKRLNSEYNSHP